MKKKFFVVAVLFLLAAGCAALEPLEVREKFTAGGSR